MNIEWRSAALTPTPTEDLEDLLFVDEYTRSNLNELLMNNQETWKEPQTKYPRYASQLKNGFGAAQLVEKGMSSANLEEA